MKLYLDGNEIKDNVLYEQTTYLLDLNGDDFPVEIVRRNYSSIVKHIHGKLYTLNVKNYVGSLHLLGKTFSVKSYKWEEEYVQKLWMAVSKELSSLPYSAFRPTKQLVERSNEEETIKIQQWVFVRDRILYESEAINAWEWIAREPHQAMLTENETQPVWKAKSMNGKSWELLMNAGNLERLGPSHPFRHRSLAHILNRNQHDNNAVWFPKEVKVIKKYLTYDTKENRFILMFLRELWELTEWMEKQISKKMSNKRIHRLDDLRRENTKLRRWLLDSLKTNWLQGISVSYHIPQNSTVLQRRKGYRHWFGLYQEYMQGSRYPLKPEEFNNLLETREISKMFEYWCFFQVLQAIEQATKSKRSALSLSGDKEWGRYLAEGFHLVFTYNGTQGALYYNRTFSNPESYSVKLRPDISLFWNEAWYHFDAKYKDLEFSDFLAEDIKKMHVYKDAIRGTVASFALYPAEQVQVSNFHQSHNNQLNNGVGSLSLSVHENNEQLLSWVDMLIKGKVI
ncbi:DUF2357 domain-containing protein [Paenibacillus sp. WQ 127069]|uniref:DUF2357 domain-containing protein n=1 Tax=Paenibacillus baimaensis TaxID=2982185 RepID=A0ABT2URY8_9BACL|nr:DUF2357 domain-containing protein [Paenibacillus sp. WQ 127069]MCU6796821.1 DUF2357 domain-containing protein [Paenibacillus sp. WQ 127069]